MANRLRVARFVPSFLLAAAVLGLAACGGSGSNTAPPQLTVTASVPLSLTASAPWAVDAPDAIWLTFGEPLDGATVPGAVTLQAARPGGAWVDDPPVDVVWDPGSPAEVVVRPRGGSKLPEGEAFRLRIGTAIRSRTGAALDEDLVGYFATDHTIVLGPRPLSTLAEGRSVIYAISDIHMGDKRSFDQKYGWLQDNWDPLQKFLAEVATTPDLKELVIVGDLFDEWVAPMNVSAFGGLTEAQFVASIADRNPGVVSALNAIIQGGNVRVTYVPGNHDMLVQPEEVDAIFNGIDQARDARGLGAYSPPEHPEIVFEHGHRYDFFNAPDPISNQSIAPGAIVPPGLFVSKIASTSDQRHHLAPGLPAPPDLSSPTVAGVNIDYGWYLVAWEAILLGKPPGVPRSAKIIETGIDGFTGTYAIDDLVPYLTLHGLDVDLYKGIERTWWDRQDANLVQVPIPKELAIFSGAVGLGIDAEADIQYFSNKNSDKRIVVFGHTHATKIVPFRDHRGRPCIYANSGTWVDHVTPKTNVTMTFVVIVPPKDDGVVTTVTTYQYRTDGPPLKLDSAAIVN